jgi:hypothetical protein
MLARRASVAPAKMPAMRHFSAYQMKPRQTASNMSPQGQTDVVAFFSSLMFARLFCGQLYEGAIRAVVPSYRPWQN